MVGLLNIVLVLFFILTIQPNETSLLTITSRGSPKKIVPKYLSKAARESVVQSLPLKTFAAAGAGKEDETVLPEPDVIRAEFKITGTATTFPSDPVEFYKQLVAADYTLLGCHENWLGIREMTLKLSKHTNIPVVMFGDTTLPNDKESFYEELKKLKVRSLHVQGIVWGVLDFGKLVKSKQEDANNKDNPGIFLSVAYHSGISVHNTAPSESMLLGQAMESAKEGEIFLTFIEPDQAEYATRLGVPSCVVWPTFDHEDRKPDPLSSELSKGGERGPEQSSLNVGILGTSTRLPVKNFFPQAGAACLFENATIYLNTIDVVEGFDREQVAEEWHLKMCRGKLKEIGWVTTEEFNTALRKMDVNLYVSASDAIPNVVLNSLAFGVPVISSDTSSIYETSPFLKNLLVEPRIDDQVAIYQRAATALSFLGSNKKNRERYDKEVDNLFKALDRRARESWGCLLQSRYGAPACIDQHGNCNYVK